MIYAAQEIKDELINKLQQLYGARLIEFSLNPDGSINVTTDKGEFLVPKNGSYTVKEGE